MPLSAEQQYLQQSILQEELQKIDLTNDQVIEVFVKYLDNLQVNSTSLRIIKTLMQAYGLPVIIFMKTFYEKVSSPQSAEFVKKNSKMFGKLAAIADEESDYKYIQYIQFVFRFGKPTAAVNPTQKQEIALTFIQFVQQIQRINKEINQLENLGIMVELKQKIEHYNNFLKQIVSNNIYELDKIMIKSIQRITFSQNQLESKVKLVKSKLQQLPIHKQKQQSSEQQQQQPKQKQNLQHVQSIKFQTANPSSLIDLDDSNSSFFSSVLNNSSHINFYDIIANQKPQQNINVSDENMSKNYGSGFNNFSKNNTELKLMQKRKRTLCCQTYFYFQEEIVDSQSITASFIHAPYPFRKQKIDDIRKIICSFLNSDGGILYIGFAYQKNKWVVIGSQIKEGEQQDLWKTFRQICSSIEPDILTHKIYQIDFVPLKNIITDKFIPQNFVIKVTVNYGARDQIYSFKQDKFQYFPFRCGSQVLFKQGRDLLKQLNTRIAQPLPVPKPLHSYPCLKPEVNKFQEKVNKKNELNPAPHLIASDNHKKKIFDRHQNNNTYQSHKVNYSPAKLVQKPKSPRVKPFIVHYDSQSPQFKAKTANKDAIVAQNKDKQGVKRTQQLFSQKQPSELKWVYFYSIGITQKQLSNVFEKKNLLSHMKIEEFESGLSIKVQNEEAIYKARRIFIKLAQKYVQKSLAFYELSLEIQTDQMKKVITELHSAGIEQYKVITDKKIRFKYYKDSLRAFLLLKQKKINVYFSTQ